MPHSEATEKVRQEIMRLRELLNIMKGHLAAGERDYDALFAGITPEEREGVREKDLQLMAAERLGGDVEGLERAAMRLRMSAHELDRAFEELYDVIMTPPIEDDD